MNSGTRIRVIKKLPCDFNYISIGDTGTVVEEGADLVWARLDKHIGMNIDAFPYLYRDGTYQFGKDQLEVIE